MKRQIPIADSSTKSSSTIFHSGEAKVGVVLLPTTCERSQFVTSSAGISDGNPNGETEILLIDGFGVRATGEKLVCSGGSSTSERFLLFEIRSSLPTDFLLGFFGDTSLLKMLRHSLRGLDVIILCESYHTYAITNIQFDGFFRALKNTSIPFGLDSEKKNFFLVLHFVR